MCPTPKADLVEMYQLKAEMHMWQVRREPQLPRLRAKAPKANRIDADELAKLQDNLASRFL